MEELRDAGAGENGDPVFFSFAAADEDSAVIEVDIFDAQADAFRDTEAAAVHEGDLEVFWLGELGEDFCDFLMREDGREAFRHFRMGGEVHIAEGVVKDLVVEEGDSIEGLVLGGSGDGESFGEVGEELMDFFWAHIEGMPGIMEEDESFDPSEVGVSCTGAEVSESRDIAYLVEEFWFR